MELILNYGALVSFVGAILGICLIAVLSVGHNNMVLRKINKAAGQPPPELSYLGRGVTLFYLRICMSVCIFEMNHNLRKAQRLVQKMIYQLEMAVIPKRTRVLTVMGCMVGTPIFAITAMWYFSQLGNGLLIVHGSPPAVMEWWAYPSVTTAAIFIGWLAGGAINEGRAYTAK